MLRTVQLLGRSPPRLRFRGLEKLLLNDNSNGRFAIHASTGEITVLDGSLLNYELFQTHSITVRVTDTNGATYDEVFTVNLNDVNETPVAVNDSNTAVEAGGVSNGTAGSNPTGNVLTNDTDIDAGDTKTVSGVVAGTAASANGSVGAIVAGNYGSLTLAANGSYTYSVDNSNSAVQALRTSGNTLQDVFTYTMVDSGGLTSTTQVTITIQGAKRQPYCEHRQCNSHRSQRLQQFQFRNEPNRQRVDQ